MRIILPRCLAHAAWFKARVERSSSWSTTMSTSSPIQQIPIEVLQHIFSLCRPSERHPKIDPTEAPLLLTQVCHEWKNVAESRPTLWCYFLLSVPNPAVSSMRDYEWYYQLFKKWMSFVKDQPITFVLSDGGGDRSLGADWDGSVQNGPVDSRYTDLLDRKSVV